MIRSIVAIGIASCFILLLGASNKNHDTKVVKRYCTGYSVIEVDKGIDCNGDTIKLVKVNGFFERAPIEQPETQIDS